MEAAKRDRVDLVVLNDAPLVLQFEALCPNVLLYARDDFHHGCFFSKVARMYWDFEPHFRRQRPDDPRAWMDRARGNLIRARQRLPNVYLKDLCFDAQQAAEKALKALCIERSIEFPFVHDPARLITLLQDQGQTVPDG